MASHLADANSRLSKSFPKPNPTRVRLLQTVREEWGWTGLVPDEIVNLNPFGNLIVKATSGAYWRICPENLTREKIAADTTTFGAVWNNHDFQIDWQMTRLFTQAYAKLGSLREGCRYCFVLSPALGGTCEESNLGSISFKELIGLSGCPARPIKDVPEGGQFSINWI